MLHKLYSYFYQDIQSRFLYTKPYNFTNIVTLRFLGSGGIKWDFVHGLFENAIYGGRVDNNFDVRVLTSYLQKYFSETLIVSPI